MAGERTHKPHGRGSQPAGAENTGSVGEEPCLEKFATRNGPDRRGRAWHRKARHWDEWKTVSLVGALIVMTLAIVISAIAATA